MICKLCGEDRKLIEAHVIPKSFHRLDPHDPTPARLATSRKLKPDGPVSAIR